MNHRARNSIDRTGVRSGKRVVIRYVETVYRFGKAVAIWEVKCDCGAISNISYVNFAKTKACLECSRKSASKKIRENKAKDVRKKRIADVGKRVGTRTLIRIIEKGENRARDLWEVECDCGNLQFILYSAFVRREGCPVCLGDVERIKRRIGRCIGVGDVYGSYVVENVKGGKAVLKCTRCGKKVTRTARHQILERLSCNSCRYKNYYYNGNWYNMRELVRIVGTDGVRRKLREIPDDADINQHAKVIESFKYDILGHSMFPGEIEKAFGISAQKFLIRISKGATPMEAITMRRQEQGKK